MHQLICCRTAVGPTVGSFGGIYYQDWRVCSLCKYDSMFEPFHNHRKFSNNRTTFRKSLSFSDNYVFVGIFYKSRWFWKTDYSSLAILENSSLVKIINHWQSVCLVKSLDNVQCKSIRYLVNLYVPHWHILCYIHKTEQRKLMTKLNIFMPEIKSSIPKTECTLEGVYLT